MARRTLSSTWKQFTRLHRQIEKTAGPDPKRIGEFNDLVEKVNASRIGDALATLFVRPHGLEEYNVLFAPAENGQFPEWKTCRNEEKNEIWVNVDGVFKFVEECHEAAAVLKTPEARQSFQRYRFQAYLAELGKLPARYVMFLLILREVAQVRKVTDVEKKGGEIEVQEGKIYLELLWAFKELENFFQRNNGLHLRSEYGILWLESDWFVGK